MHEEHGSYMRRCLQLAVMGAGHVAPNPMVGAVLVYDDIIIGEGYHKEYGKAHAEVNCIASVEEKNKEFIGQSILYVSLEPCTHLGKTPPCTDLIIKNEIPKVVIGCSDPFKEVNGKGIQKLQQAGLEVVTDVLEDECKKLNRRFFIYQVEHRPYVILKWAQTADSKIAYNDNNRLLISSEIANRVVHKWRAQEAAILVGTNTALKDDPYLTNRLWGGRNPIRLVIDMDLKLPGTLHIFNGEAPSVIFNLRQNNIEFLDSLENDVNYYQLTSDISIIHQILNACYKLNIQSLLVEGGARLLQSFIDEDIWDEARVITNQHLFIGSGLPAPDLRKMHLRQSEYAGTDRMDFFERQT